MSRYIDADALVIDYYEDYETKDDIYTYAYVSKAQINSAPSIDIVRCKECAYWQPYENNPEIKVCTCNYRMSFARYPDDFCSRGERRNDE